MVLQLVLLGAAQAQVPNDATGLPHVFEYPLPPQTVVLEFNQDECQASATEEYVIPDVPANPGNGALTILFNSVCDLGSSTAGTIPVTQGAPREIIEEYLVSPDNSRMLVKFGKYQSKYK
jgi:hypothetical protein